MASNGKNIDQRGSQCFANFVQHARLALTAGLTCRPTRSLAIAKTMPTSPGRSLSSSTALAGGVDHGHLGAAGLEPHHIADLEALRQDSCSMRALPRAGFLISPVLAICLLLIC